MMKSTVPLHQRGQQRVAAHRRWEPIHCCGTSSTVRYSWAGKSLSSRHPRPRHVTVWCPAQLRAGRSTRDRETGRSRSSGRGHVLTTDSPVGSGDLPARRQLPPSLPSRGETRRQPCRPQNPKHPHYQPQCFEATLSCCLSVLMVSIWPQTTAWSKFLHLWNHLPTCQLQITQTGRQNKQLLNTSYSRSSDIKGDNCCSWLIFASNKQQIHAKWYKFSKAESLNSLYQWRSAANA